MRLLDVLARQLTGGEHPFDPGGRLAVQGTKIAELLEHWLADPWFDRPLPRWHPHGVRPERFLNDAIRMAVEADWSVRDLLCTATHLIAESVVRAIARRLPEQTPRRPDRPDRRRPAKRHVAAQDGRATAGDDVDADRRIGHRRPSAWGRHAIAVLAFCHLDQVPANPTAVTGAEIPRVLGPSDARLAPELAASARPDVRQPTGHPPVAQPV